jgi:integrase
VATRPGRVFPPRALNQRNENVSRISDSDRFAEGPVGPAQPIAWEAFEQEVLSLYSPPSCAPATRGKIKQVLRLVKELGVTSTADLTVGLVARFVAARPPAQSPWTLKSLLMALRSICSFAAASGYSRSPFTIRRLSRWVDPQLQWDESRHISREHTRKLLELLQRESETLTGWAGWRARRLWVLVAIVAYTGLRRSEALNLEVSDIDLEQGCIWIGRSGQQLKTRGSRRPVPMPRVLISIVQNWLGHRLDAPYGFPLPDSCPWVIPNLSRRGPWLSGHARSRPIGQLQAAAKRAGIDHVTWQHLRRGYATHAESWGFGEALIQRILRHSSPMTSRQFYRAADIDNLRSAVDGIQF